MLKQFYFLTSQKAFVLYNLKLDTDLTTLLTYLHVLKIKAASLEIRLHTIIELLSQILRLKRYVFMVTY